MESLGTYLRDLRLARGLSIEEVARATRVGSRYLEALEGNRWPQLPAPAFTKGFIRAYCQALGEPPDEAISRYTAALSKLHPPAPVPPVTSASRRRARGPVLVSALLLIAFGLGLYLVSGGRQERPTSELTTPVPPAVKVSAQPIPTEPSPPVSPMALQADAQARLVARTTEPTWVRVRLDNARVIEELLPAGATREWRSDQRFVLTIGNAGGISLELNGRLLPPLGARGAVIQQLVLPPDAKATGP